MIGFQHVVLKSGSPFRHLIERDPLDFRPLDIATSLCGVTGRWEEWMPLPQPPLCRACVDKEMGR